ncbi:MAG: hypothetical protein J5897_00655 [Candidatus Methanomethylophilus sp.]|nr:hypothetical protein [Methanomethylophilus sp.]
MKKIMLKDVRACWFGFLPPEEEVNSRRSIRHLLRPVPVLLLRDRIAGHPSVYQHRV